MDLFRAMEGGRSRWKVENETFRTLKHGYGLNHNYGHGEENFSMNAFLMATLVFLIEQIFELKNKLYKKAVEVYKYKSHLWDIIRSAYIWRSWDNWKHLLEFLIRKKLKAKYPHLDTS